MGSCTRRHFLLSTCFLQMVTIIERQVFDFLGYMWAPIMVNFFHIIFVIFGFYGAYHFRIKYIITYLIWSFIWIGWNSFLICFYLNVGTLDRESDTLNLGTGSFSWFELNGYGCKPVYPTNITSDDPYRPIRPERVDDCLVSYEIVEIIHSGVQCVLAFFGILGAILISYIFLDEDDRLKHINKISKHRQSLYSIECGPSLDSLRSRADTILDYDDRLNERSGADGGGELSLKPMTPRRVKRRSVMARGANSRQSTTSSRRSHYSSGTHSRSSTRSSRRKYQQNTVTKLLDQQQKQLQQHFNSNATKQQQFGSFHHKSGAPLTETNLQTLNCEITSDIVSAVGNVVVSDGLGVGVSGIGSLTKTNNNKYRSFRKNIPPDPIYYNMNLHSGLLLPTATPTQATWLAPSPNISEEPSSPTTLRQPHHHHHHLHNHHASTSTVSGGHFNPTYQHSTTNLNDPSDEVYNNRPPSVRSSYSNFHGTRPLSLYNTTTENVFVELTGAVPQQQQQQQQQQYVAPSTPPLYQQHPLQQKSQSQSQSQLQHQTHNLPPPLPSPNSKVQGTRSSPQNIPFAKRTASRESIRSMAFLNSGPPAYNLNYHTPPDSETTM